MSLLNDLKTAYHIKNTHFLLINSKGVILEHDNTLFNVELNTSISDIHPFFLSIDTTNETNFTCVHLDVNTEKLICDIQVKPLEDDLCLVILSDFSMHYNSFQSLAQLRNETSIASEVTQINNQLLLEKEDFKNKFISNFSHEIISPIMSIMTFGNVLDKTNLTQEQQDYINVINASAYHLKAMVNDVLDLSKIETNNLEITHNRFSFKKLIKTIETEYALKSKQKNLGFEIDYDYNMPNYIVSDKTRVQQIIKNLLDNALKFTDSGSISVKIHQIYRRARHLTFSIVIKDTGRGIEKEQQDKIFERFRRLDNVKQTQGAGLGLTIAKEITNLLNGTIDVESEPEVGTTFTVTIRAKTPLTDINKKKLKTIEEEFPKDLRILLVDNNLTDQLSIFKILAKNKNFYLDISSNGLEAIELVKQNHYDLVLMDYYMPKLDGIKTSKALKKINDDLPILLITGSYINKKLLEFQDVYFKHILNKPFDEETLINSIYMCVK